MGFFSTIRSWMMRLFPLKPAVRAFGIKLPDVSSVPDLQETWTDIYSGSGDRSGGKRVFNVAALLCYDVSRLSVGEAEITSQDKTVQKIIDNVISPMLQRAVEESVAKGGAAIRPWLDTMGNPHADLYRVGEFLPVDFQDDRITAMMFVDQKTIKTEHQSVTYTKLELQRWTPPSAGKAGKFSSTTKAFRKDGEATDTDIGRECSLALVPEWESITPEWTIANVNAPLFVYIRAPWRVASSGVIGASIFSNAVDQIQELNDRKNQLSWEFRSGKRKMIVDESALPINPDTGKLDVKPADAELYRKLSGSQTAAGAIQDYWADYSPEIRYEAYHADIRQLLIEISILCHMDSGYLIQDAQSGAITAKEVTVREKNSYATVCNVQTKTARPAIEELLSSFSVLLSLGGDSFDAEAIKDISIVWGDGIMDSPDAERDIAQSEVLAGLRSKKDYMIHFRGLTEEEADAELAQIGEETPSYSESFQGS